MMKLAAVLFFVCGLGAGLASSIWMFIIFHLIGGIGIGFSSVAAPAYIAEISPPRFRGRLGSLQQLAIVCGIFGALALTWLPFHLAGGSGKPLWLGLAAWRWTFLSELILALLYFALLFTIPSRRVIWLPNNSFRKPARCWRTARRPRRRADDHSDR